MSAVNRADRQRRPALHLLRARETITDLNQSARTDSKLSLDTRVSIRDSVAMITQPYQVYIERTDAARNMARYYAMQISVTLFGETCLTRRWGRIGRSGQTMVHHFDREEDAVVLFLELARQKRARGYRSRNSQHMRLF